VSVSEPCHRGLCGGQPCAPGSLTKDSPPCPEFAPATEAAGLFTGEPSQTPVLFFSRRSTATPRRCCCLTSQRSPEMECTNSSNRSSRLLSSSPDVAVSFLESVPVAEGMVEKCGESDTRLSRVQRGETRMRGCKLYLNVTGGRGPRPRQRGGAVLAPHWRGRRLQGISLIKHSMTYSTGWVLLISSQLDPTLTD
jgi:hypothetical protein